MADVEMVLRFLAFYEKSYLRYTGRMKQFFNRLMEERRSFTPEQRQDFERAFRKSVELTWTVFGTRSFRRYVTGDEKNPNGKWQNSANKALFDVVMWGFTLYDKRQVVESKDLIREEMLKLLTEDDEFIGSIISSTADPQKVKTRFERWKATLERVITPNIGDKRLFTLRDKKDAFDKDPTCKICRQRIEELDDAEMDHIQPYAIGGKTTPENARITHRFCNRTRTRASTV